MTPDPTPRPVRRGLSLEHRLPLMITALLVVTMAAVLVFAWAEVRRAAIASAQDRLRRVAEQLAIISGPTIPQRLQVMRAAGAAPALTAYLRAPSGANTAAATQGLQALRTPAETELPIMLWDRA